MTMHYKNGREAKNGDKIAWMSKSYGGDPTVIVGILINATAGNDFCNGAIVPIPLNPSCPNLKECLHLDDFTAALESGQILKGQVDSTLEKQVARSEAEAEKGSIP